MKNILLLIMLSFTVFANAQTGTLKGTITDKNGEVVMFATVAIKRNGSLITGIQTDFDGKYQFDSLSVGMYDILVSYAGYQTKTTAGVVIFPNKNLVLNIEISQEVEIIGCPVFYYYPNLFDLGNMTQSTTFSADEIQRNPIKN